MKNTKYLAAGLLGLAFLCWPCPGIHAAESRHLAQMSHDPGGFEELTWNETLPSMQKKFVLEYLGKEASGLYFTESGRCLYHSPAHLPENRIVTI